MIQQLYPEHDWEQMVQLLIDNIYMEICNCGFIRKVLSQSTQRNTEFNGKRKKSRLPVKS